VIGIDRNGRSTWPESALFLFTNKKRNRLKLLWHDRTGFCLLYKRLDLGYFRIPEAAPGATSLAIDPAEMEAILEGIQLPSSRTRARDIAQKARNAALQL